MRYPAAEKLEVIQLVERSHQPAKQTLDMLGIPRTTFYRWYERYRRAGQDARSIGLQQADIFRRLERVAYLLNRECGEVQSAFY